MRASHISPTHSFLEKMFMIQTKKKLQNIYTENIGYAQMGQGGDSSDNV